MSGKRIGLVAAVVVAIALTIYLTRWRHPAVAPHATGPAIASAPTAAAVAPAATAPRASAPGHTLDPAARKLLRAALAEARAARAAQGNGATAAASPDGPRPQLDDPHTTDLALRDKTGDESAWEKRQLGVLQQLLGECYDLARAGDPSLEGKVALLFTVSAEPDIGGLVDDIRFDEAGTTIASPDLRECMRQSLYALELDPPPQGLSVSRMITLDLHPDD